MFNVHITKVSSNAKTGPIPVTTTGAQSCPDSCSLKNNGCYAAGGPLGIHWKAVSNGNRGMAWDDAMKAIKALPRGILARHNQAGDLPGQDDKLDSGLMLSLLLAFKGKRGFTYTHYPVLQSEHSSHNAALIKQANNNGFTINLSAESLEEADRMLSLGIGPVVTLLPEDAPKALRTAKGNKVVTCPATYRDDVSCYTCAICQDNNSKRAIIGFPAHGVSKKKAQKVFMLKQSGN